MQSRSWMRRGTAGCVAVFVTIALASFDSARERAHAAEATRTYFSYSAPASELLSGGGAQTFTPEDGTFAVGGSLGGFRITVNLGAGSWEVSLGAQKGEVLRAGVYENASGDSNLGPRIDVRAFNRRCIYPIEGRFEIRSLSADASGRVDLVEASFEQRCLIAGTPAPVLKGSFAYRAPPIAPLELTASSWGTVVGQPVTLTARVPAGSSGDVTFADGGAAIGSASVDAAGLARFTTSTLTAGTHAITATFGAETSRTHVQTVRGGNLTFWLTSDAEDYVGGGLTASYVSPEHGIEIGAGPTQLNMRVRAPELGTPWFLQLYAVAGLKPGGVTSLQFGGDGRGCSGIVDATLEIHSISYSNPYTLSAFEATFAQACNSLSSTGLTGRIHYVAPNTPSGVPGTPEYVNATAGTLGAATVAWYAPEANASPITGYVVTTWPGGASMDVPSTQTSATVTGLVDGDPYTFTVRATNAHGDSPESLPAGPVVPAGVPDAPVGVLAERFGEAVIVSWVPTDSNGSFLQSYVVSSVPSGVTKTVTFADRQVGIAGLKSGVAYRFSVRAKNAIGVGPAAMSMNTVTVKRKPGAPVLVRVTGDGPGAVRVSWSAPSSGGSPITGYTVSVNGGRTVAATSAARTARVAGLPDGSSTFRVRARNALGSGAWSLPVGLVVQTGYSYVARYSEAQYAYFVKVAAFFKMPVADVPKTGVRVLAYLLAVAPHPRTRPLGHVANVGPRAITATFSPTGNASTMAPVREYLVASGNDALHVGGLLMQYLAALSGVR